MPRSLRNRPLLRYHGGKWMLAPWIISNFPEHRIYTEVFGGGASVLLRKPRAYAEVYNDLDGEIVNVFQMVRSRGEELKKYLYLTPFARQAYLESHKKSNDPLVTAGRTIMKAFMGFGSDGIKNNTGFRANSNRSGTTPAHDWANYPEQIPIFIERLRGVVIECRPASEVLLAHDGSDTLHYIDPPYLHSTRKSAHRYRFEMTDKEHQKLAKVIKLLRGKVVISGYRSALYDKLYGGYRREEKLALADGAKKRVEALWFNFDSEQNRLKL